MKLLVVGLGNRLRQDDAFGPIVAEELEKCFDDERVEIREQAALTPELTENVFRATHVLFVDASVDLAPGVLQRRQLTRDAESDLSLVHFLTPEALLEWTHRLYGSAPPAEIWLMGTAETGLSEQLTPVVAAQLPATLVSLRTRIEELLHTHLPS